MPKIHLTTTDGAAVDFELSAERTTVGRAEGNDFVVPDGSVSSRHGEIILKDDGGIELVDLGSTNGTYVGGERVERADVAPGGTFRLGSCEGYLEGEAGASEEISAEDEGVSGEEDEAPAPVSTGGGGWSSTPAPAAVITGLGATPCPANQREGFGPKVKKKDSSGSTMMLLGVGALVACAAACFMILRMGA